MHVSWALFRSLLRVDRKKVVLKRSQAVYRFSVASEALGQCVVAYELLEKNFHCSSIRRTSRQKQVNYEVYQAYLGYTGDFSCH